MKDTMKRLVLGIALLALPTLADTPIVQALKVEQKIRDVVEALHERGVENASFETAPQDIKQISFINEFFDGKYSGPIIYSGTSFSNTGFKGLPGKFDVYMPNATSLDTTYLFEGAIGIISFNAPKMTSLKAYSFRNCSNLKSVYLPEVSGAAECVFQGCTSLTNVYIPKNRTAGNSYAFQNCSNLKEVTLLPLTTVAAYAFDGCNQLTNVPIDKSTCTFNLYCFRNCYALDIGENEWPSSVSFSSTGYQFQNCKGLKNINPLLNKFTNIDGDITTSETGHQFQGCTGLTDLRSDNLVTLNSGYLFSGCSSVTNISFPNLLGIGTYTYVNFGYMFNGMTGLKRVDMPKLQTMSKVNNRTSWGVFAGCTSLEEIEFPELQFMGNLDLNSDGLGNFFLNCKNLRSARFPKLEELQIFGNTENHAMFPYCYNLEDLQMPSLRVLRNSSQNVGNNSLVANNYKLKNVSLPNLEKIWGRGDRMFYLCYGLKKVFMPKLTYVNNGSNKDGTKGMGGMFYLCPALTDVTLGFKGAELKAYPGFPGNAVQNTVFHCPADAPYNVDVMYLNNAWTVVTNGTFKLMDSIKGTGTQYINTGYTHKTNTLVEIDFALCPIDQNQRSYEYMWGANNGDNNNNSFGAYTAFNGSRMFVYVRNTDSARGPSMATPSEDMRYKMVCCTNRMEVFNSSGELLYSLTSPNAPNEGTCPIGIFDANRTTTKGGFAPYGGSNFPTDMFTSGPVKNMKLYRFTVKEEGETVMDLVPALVGGTGTEQVACLVDLKNGFHPLFNIGTGSFEAGNVTNDIATAYSLQE